MGRNAARLAYELNAFCLTAYLLIMVVGLILVFYSEEDEKFLLSIFFEILGLVLVILPMAASTTLDTYPFKSAGRFCGTVRNSICRSAAVSAACSVPAVACTLVAALLRYFCEHKPVMTMWIVIAVGVDIMATGWDAHQISSIQGERQACAIKCHDSDPLPISEWAYEVLIFATTLEIVTSGLDSGLLFQIVSAAS